MLIYHNEPLPNCKYPERTCRDGLKRLAMVANCYGGPGGHASRQWLSRITPVSSPPTVVTSPPSVTLMSVPFSLRTVAIPVRNADVRTVQSPYRRHSSTHANNTTMYKPGVWLSTFTATPPWLSRVRYACCLKKQSVASSPFLKISVLIPGPQCIVALSVI